MSVALMVITDGRGACLKATLAALTEHVDPAMFTRRLIVNDCREPPYAQWIDAEFDFDEQVNPARKLGFAGAIQAGWDHLGDVDWIFHLEDDFVIEREVDLAAILRVLTDHPHLLQMALRRQPWGPEEEAAGGYVEMHPDAYVDKSEPAEGQCWLEHRLFFTTNPSIYRKSLTRNGWPRVLGSEAVFSQQLFANPQATCGLWGQRTDSPLVIHIGNQRAGEGY